VEQNWLVHWRSTGKYLEFNLAPNGAWWSAVFTSPRVRESEDEVQIPDVASYADLSPDGSWLTAAAIPLHYLRDELGEPDFHQPDKFKKVNFFQLGPQKQG